MGTLPECFSSINPRLRRLRPEARLRIPIGFKLRETAASSARNITQLQLPAVTVESSESSEEGLCE